MTSNFAFESPVHSVIDKSKVITRFTNTFILKITILILLTFYIIIVNLLFISQQKVEGVSRIWRTPPFPLKKYASVLCYLTVTDFIYQIFHLVRQLGLSMKSEYPNLGSNQILIRIYEYKKINHWTAKLSQIIRIIQILKSRICQIPIVNNSKCKTCGVKLLVATLLHLRVWCISISSGFFFKLI